MAREITVPQPGLSGQTLYATIDRIGQRWNGLGFESVLAAHWNTYPVALTEAPSTGYFVGDIPAGITTPGPLAVIIYRRLGASPALLDPVVATGGDYWTGTAWGMVLAPTGLDAVSAADPAAGPPITFRDKLMWVVRRLSHASQNATQLQTFNAANVVLTTQAVTNNGIVKTVGEPS